jgi:hypothetical protein
MLRTLGESLSIFITDNSHHLVRENVTWGLLPQGFVAKIKSLAVNLKGLGAKTN